MAKARAVRSDKLTKKLKALRTETAAAVRPYVGEAAEMVADYMRYLVPVVSGDLKASIRWEFYEGAARKGQITNETRAVIQAGGGEAWYAFIVEHGTSRNEASPFFFPAYRTKKKAATAIIAKGVRNTIRGIARS